MHHHVQTLRHVELIREELAAQGKRIAKFELERGERASSERCAGNHIPDAILTLDDGATIAVEYVSTNDSDEARDEGQPLCFDLQPGAVVGELRGYEEPRVARHARRL